jgi:hypothetical protein
MFSERFAKGALGKIDDDHYHENPFPLALIEQGVEGADSLMKGQRNM